MLGVCSILMALLILIALVSHSHLDDRRIEGEVDAHLDPLDITYRNQAGILGAYIAFVLEIILGWLAYFIPVALLVAGARMFAGDFFARLRLSAAMLFGVALLSTMIYNIHILVERTLLSERDTAGGFVADRLTALSVKIVGEWGSYVVLSGLIVLIIILRWPISGSWLPKLHLPDREVFAKMLARTRMLGEKVLSLNWLRPARDDGKDGDTDGSEATDYIEDTEGGPSPKRTRQLKLKKGRGSDSDTAEADSGTGPEAEPLQVESIDYNYPVVELLTASVHEASSVSSHELSTTSEMLKQTLETFGVRIHGNIEYYPGPVITRYEFKPGTGIKVNQILNLSDDLALALKAKRIRIIAPIPGKAAVGVEIPNRQAQIVYLRDIIESRQFNRADYRLPLALGKTTFAKPYVVDLSRLPHLLIAGATGSGKSVCMNVIVTSLLYRLHPQQIRFILIDPKMLELTVYSGIPHLGRPVVTSPKRAERVLGDAVVEMEARYRKLANASVRNIEDFNAKQENPELQLPYMVILVDELADLLMSSTSSKTELLITRLAQMARAVGIHLVLATQRPSVDVITGLIKANFPARIAFQVSSKVDSRTIIDSNGAEKLLGAGDMLFLHPGQPEPRRLHGACLTSLETESIVRHIKAQELPMMKLDNISQATGEIKESEVDTGDPLFREACEVVIRHKQGSVSLLQRRLGIGYQRAARLIDKLEQAGVVSPFDGSKARDVLVDKSFLETMMRQPTGSAGEVSREQTR